MLVADSREIGGDFRNSSRRDSFSRVTTGADDCARDGGD